MAKSRMASEGKRARREKAAQRRAEAEQKLRLEAQNRLGQSEVFPRGLGGLSLNHIDNPKLPTISEIRAGTFRTLARCDGSTRWRHLSNPAFLGKANLRWLQSYWQKELEATEEKIGKLDGKIQAHAGRLPTGLVNELDTAKAHKERLKVVISYIGELIEMAEDKFPLPACREKGHFKPGDQVLCFLPDRGLCCVSERPWRYLPEVQLTFLVGTVTEITSYGSPVVQFDRPILCEPGAYGRNADVITEHDGKIMLVDEYLYLMSNDEYRMTWLWAWCGDAYHAWCHWVSELYRRFDEAWPLVNAAKAG